MEPLKTLDQCISDGVEFLDYKRPNWWTKPKRKTFDMGNGCYSLLAQIEGTTYRKALISLGLTDGKTTGPDGRPVYPDMTGIPYGFMANYSVMPGIESFSYEQLQDAWIAVIRKKREES